jgi:cytochrome c oxidase subunit 1
MFVGFNLTFFPMHQLGIYGMTRRIYTYLPETGWGRLNFVATIGALVMTVAVVLFLVNVVISLRRGLIAGPNPWGAPTLEWAATSPPQRYNFLYIPTVRGRNALWDNFDEAPVIVGLSTKEREVLNTTLLDAQPDHKYEMHGDSIWPLVLAFASGGTFLAVIFTPWALPVGCVAAFFALAMWFWRDNDEVGWIKAKRDEKPPEPLERPTPVKIREGAV